MSISHHTVHLYGQMGGWLDVQDNSLQVKRLTKVSWAIPLFHLHHTCSDMVSHASLSLDHLLSCMML